MTVLSEIKNFLSTITDWLLLLLIFTVFFFTCNIETVSVFGRLTILPVPTSPSFAAEFFSMLVSDIAPVHIPLIVTSPMTAFVVQVKLSFLLSFFFTFPVFLYRLISYLSPALYVYEQRLIYKLLIPLTLLFFGGVYFSYVTIAPSTLSVLYTFAVPIGATSLLGVSEFVGITIALLVSAGVTFTVPVFMVLLTALKAVRAMFWVENARYAFVLFLVASAIITPDGSGVSMMLLSLPVSVLYGAGALVCARVERVGNQEYKKMHTILKS